MGKNKKTLRRKAASRGRVQAIHEPQTDREAWSLIMTGIAYFLSTHFKVTVLILIAMLTGLVFGALFFASKGYDIQQVLPSSHLETGLMPSAFAGGEPIKFGNKEYPFARDPGFEVVKIMDQPAVLIWEKKTDRVFKVWISELEPRELKKYVK